MNSSPFAGKTALVTGGGKNIGRAIALAFAATGANVGIIGKTDKGALIDTATELEGHGIKSAFALADISDEKSANHAIKHIAQSLGWPSILINNAALRKNTPFEKMTLGEWREVTGTILDGTFLCARAVVPFMRKSGGAIINIGGVSAHVGAYGRAHVIAAKAGMCGLTRALAVELASDGIRVNCIVPGEIATVRGAAAGSKPVHADGVKPLIAKLGTPDDIAASAVFLASPAAKYITGQTIHVSGGMFFN
ncbi:MAG: SDR family NAD(P)-dependent oxidoreductase [Gammaproteobacteria bacterium]